MGFKLSTTKIVSASAVFHKNSTSRNKSTIGLHEYFTSLLSYDPETGTFYWLVNRGGHGGSAMAGQIAGAVTTSAKSRRSGDGSGYIAIMIDGKLYRAHRLAWFFMTGAMPGLGQEIDHINRKRADNRWSNLRLVTHAENCHNSGTRSDNVSGVRGVCWSKQARKWCAQIQLNGKHIHLGFSGTIEEAAELRRAAERKYHGESQPVI